jgi:hypothetical protein
VTFFLGPRQKLVNKGESKGTTNKPLPLQKDGKRMIVVVVVVLGHSRVLI